MGKNKNKTKQSSGKFKTYGYQITAITSKTQEIHTR